MRAGPTPQPPDEPACGRALRVMLVDDHAIVREGYRRLLESEGGIEVVAECADAGAAQARLAALRPAPRSAGDDPPPDVDVVVLDLSMPGRGGLDALRHLAARWPGLRVLVFSMHEHPAVVAEALGAGAAGYVGKTAEPQELVAALRRVAAGERAVRSAELAAAADAPAGRSPAEALSAREFEVYRLLAEGLGLDAIAARLCVSAKTVSNVQTQIRAKLGVATAVELLRHAQRHGLAGP